MYKNFTLTESEKEQILNQHKNHGYKKPLMEENEDMVPAEELPNEIPQQNDGITVYLVAVETDDGQTDLLRAKVFRNNADAIQYANELENQYERQNNRYDDENLPLYQRGRKRTPFIESLKLM